MMVVDALDPASVNPQELVVLIVAIGGLIPVYLYYQRSTRWLLGAYAFLLIGAFTTNVENVFWYDGFNLVEHSIGNLGAGIAFAAAAYAHRCRLLAAVENGSETAER